MNKKIEYIKFVLPILIIFFWFIFTYTGKVPETSLPKLSSVKNTFFEFKLNKNNLIYHLQVWNIIENKKFKSESISLLVKALSSKAGV